jgi:hypothetical protein
VDLLVSVVLLAVACAVFWLLLMPVPTNPIDGDRRAPVPPPAPVDPWPADHLVQVLFATGIGERVVLDCVAEGPLTLPDGEPVERGTPFSVSAELPLTARWAADATQAILQQWAATGTEVSMLLARGSDGPCLRLSDESVHLQLPVV